MEDDEAHQAGEDYGRGLVEEEVDSCLVWMKSEPPEREHFLEERRGGSEIDRLSEAMFRCRQRAKGVKDFFLLTYPRGGREIVSRKRKDNGKREIAD